MGLTPVRQLYDAEDFDKDRQEILDRLDACIAPRKQLHELEWELRKRSGEIHELQQARHPSFQASMTMSLFTGLALGQSRGLAADAVYHQDHMAGPASHVGAWAQALASSQTFIYEERERLLALQAENEDLRLQQAEDKARMDCIAVTLEASKAGGASPKGALRAACSSDSINELKLRLASCQNQLAEQVHILHA